MTNYQNKKDVSQDSKSQKSCSETSSVVSFASSMTSSGKPNGTTKSDKKLKTQKRGNRAQRREAAITKSSLDDMARQLAEHDLKESKDREKKRAKAQARLAKWEWMKQRFEGMNFTVHQEPITCPVLAVVAIIHLILLTAVLIAAPQGRDLGALPILAVCSLSLGTVALGKRAYERSYRKILFLLSATVYLAFITTAIVAQIYFESAAALMLVIAMSVFSAHSIAVVILIWVGKRVDRLMALNPRPLATYKFVSWEELGQDDMRPDCNRKKEIDHESVNMWVQIEHHTFPKRRSTIKVCAETVAQACGQGVILGTGDLEACASAAEGAMRRLSTVNVNKTALFERGIQCHRTLHLVKAILKHSKEKGVSLEPELGF